MEEALKALVFTTLLIGTSFAQSIKIDLAHGSDRERQTKALLEQVIASLTLPSTVERDLNGRTE